MESVGKKAGRPKAKSPLKTIKKDFYLSVQDSEKLDRLCEILGEGISPVIRQSLRPMFEKYLPKEGEGANETAE